MEFKVKSAYASNYLHIVLWTTVAFITGPFLVFSVVNTALQNRVDDALSWSIIGLACILFSYISYSKFRYLVFVIWESYEIRINKEDKAVLVQPGKITVILSNVKEFVYLEEYKSYVIRFKEIGKPVVTLEIGRNKELENAVEHVGSLNCKTE